MMSGRTLITVFYSGFSHSLKKTTDKFKCIDGFINVLFYLQNQFDAYFSLRSFKNTDLNFVSIFVSYLQKGN